MIHIFNRVLLYKTNNMAHYAMIRRALTRKSIRFSVKMDGRRMYSAGWRYGLKGSTGDKSENKSFDNMYSIYVHRQDLELAKYVLKEAFAKK